MELKRTELNPFDIAFDKDNPRGESPKQIENDVGFKRLKEDIKTNGLFYPVVIKKEDAFGKKYVLIDGERRLRATQSLKLEKIPVIIISGEENKHIIAFRLNNFGKPWSMRVWIKATETIISDLKEKGKSEEEIIKYVNELTGMSKEKIKDILKVWRYGPELVRSMGKKEFPRTFLVQSEDVFLPLIQEEFPNILNQFSEEKIRGVIGKKLLNKKLGNTKVFRNLRDYLKNDCKNKKQAEERISLFLKTPNIDLQDVMDGERSQYNESSEESKYNTEVNEKGNKSENYTSTSQSNQNSTYGNRKSLIPKDYKLKIKNEKVRKIYEELQKLELKNFIHVTSISFRVFVELTMDCYLERHKLIGGSVSATRCNIKDLKQKVFAVANHLENAKKIDSSISQGIKTAVKDGNTSLSMDTIQGYLHNNRFSPISENLITMWNNSEDFIRIVWENID
jgi:ParB/RepB/Spo0J family partition protein